MVTGVAWEQKAARWLEHLQAWRSQGGLLSGYSRTQGLSIWDAYRWRRTLRREGRWMKGATAVQRRAIGRRLARDRADLRQGPARRAQLDHLLCEARCGHRSWLVVDLFVP